MVTQHMLIVRDYFSCFATAVDKTSNSTRRSISLFEKRSFNVSIRCYIAVVTTAFRQP